MSGNVEQRHRIGGIAEEPILIDIKTNAVYTALEGLAYNRCLDERTANLAVAPIDIVRPL